MTTVIERQSVNEVVLKSLKELTKTPVSNTRNGGASALYNVFWKVQDPRQRHLYLNGRTSNIFQMIAETFWVLSGDNQVNGWLSFFLPRATQYSDDGETWHGAYGDRIYAFDQLQGVVDRFKSEGKDTRRGVVSIYDPNLDSPQGIEHLYGEGHTPRDVPCNNMLYFYVDNYDQFHLHTTQRSGDIIFGAGSINLFEFTFMQEIMFELIRKEYPEIKLGYYSHYINNLHLYDSTRQQAENIVNSDGWLAPGTIHRPAQSMDLGNIEHTEDMREFFDRICQVFEAQVNGVNLLEDSKFQVDAILDEYKIPQLVGMNESRNMIHMYIFSVLEYIAHKKEGLIYNVPCEGIELTDLFNAIHHSGFIKEKGWS